ncbi:MAG: SixA phosphatase family protein [Roseibacillus sp.]
MDVIFVRHGKANDHGPDGGDHGRRLTDKGWKQSRAVGDLLTKLELVPDLVLSSPRTRAFETAAGVMAAAGMEGNPVIQEWLNFDLRPQTVMEELGALPDEIGRVVLVGHEPTFSGMVAWLLGAETGYAEVKKASVVRFELSPPSRHGALLKMLVPVKALF